MSPDEVRRAGVVFLDQFIQRGAAQDVRRARDSLAPDASAQEGLASLLPTGEVAAREGYDCLRAWLARQPADETSPADLPNVPMLLGWMEWGFAGGVDDGETADPAQWHDWLTAVSQVEPTS